MNKKAVKSCLGREGINNGRLIAHFMTKKSTVSVIVVSTPVEPIDKVSSDNVSGKNRVFLIGDLAPRLVEIGKDGIIGIFV